MSDKKLWPHPTLNEKFEELYAQSDTVEKRIKAADESMYLTKPPAKKGGAK